MALRKERLAERLLELRTNAGLSQEGAAQKVGVTVRQWQRWEQGESVPYPRNLDTIASRFGITVAEFFDEPPRADIAATLAALSERIAELEQTANEQAEEMAEMQAALRDASIAQTARGRRRKDPGT